MNTKSSSRDIARRLFELLVGALTVMGLLLILFSFTIPAGGAQNLLRGIGLSLFPAGVVAFLLSRFAANITEILLTQTVERTIEIRLKEEIKRIEKTVDQGLTVIDENMKRLSPLFISASKMGLENLHLTRSMALQHFLCFLDAEVNKANDSEPASVWFVASSIKGFLETAVENFNGQQMMERIVQSKCDLRIMMTDPKIADSRAKQEGRGEGDIPAEIMLNMASLKRIGVKRESVKLYSGVPTVFAIATTDRMLLNPYPNQAEAFRCFSIIVHKTLNIDDIFQQYLRFHFNEPWEQAADVPPELWDKL